MHLSEVKEEKLDNLTKKNAENGNDDNVQLTAHDHMMIKRSFVSRKTGSRSRFELYLKQMVFYL
jgi:hypothetical protein